MVVHFLTTDVIAEGKRWLALCLLLGLIQSCAYTQSQHPAFDANRRDSIDLENTQVQSGTSEAEPVAKEPGEEPEAVEGAGPAVTESTRFGQTPSVPPIRTGIVNPGMPSIEFELTGEPIQVNYNNLPIPAFINEVFGDQLNLSYTIDPELAQQTDLVTLRINGLTDRDELFRVAQSTLKTYGVVIEQREELLTFAIDSTGSGGDVPLLVSGRSLPDVPDSLRPIFMFVPLEVVSNTRVRSWLTSALTGQNIQVREDPTGNAIVLQGRPAVVEQALSIIDFLDQPAMRGQYSISIEPSFLSVEDMERNLEQVLRAEGYSVSTNPAFGNIVLLSMSGRGNLVVFAPNQALIDHVAQWAETIDQRQQLSIDSGIFSYKAQNVRADHIVGILNEIEGGRGARRSGAATSGTDGQSSNSPQPQSILSGSLDEARFVVDENRNAIVFKGSGQQWLELLPVIRDMDQPAPSVLVEVLIAEVTLNDQEATGIEWLANGSVDIDGRTYTSNYGTVSGLSLGSAGFNFTLDSAGQTRAALNVFYENERAEIRSRPRLMVKSGQTASINVGSEIPTVSSESRSTADPDAPLVSNVQYRTTGLSLTISPIVHSSGYIDIEIEQELSESRLTTTSGIDSPTIFNREISTVVTLKDGGSILLGGLVSSSGGTEQRGIPVLGKIPGVGRLFRTDSETQDRTELMILVMPFVLDDPQQASELREQLVPEYNL